MTRDEQYALSLRYGPTPFLVLPCPSGAVAVIGHHRQLLGIFDTWIEARACGETQPPPNWLKHGTPEPKPEVLDLNLDDIDLTNLEL